VPIYETENCRLRLLVGAAFGLSSPLEIPQDLLMIEGWSESELEIPVPVSWKVWLYSRDVEIAGYTATSVVKGRFLLVASP